MKLRKKTWIPLETFERLQDTASSTRTNSAPCRSASDPPLRLHRQWSPGARPQRSFSEALAHYPLRAVDLQRLHEEQDTTISKSRGLVFPADSTAASLTPESGSTSALGTPSVLGHHIGSGGNTSLGDIVGKTEPRHGTDLDLTALPGRRQLRASSGSSGVTALDWEDGLIDTVFFADWLRSSNDMATTTFRMGDARRQNRYENRPPMSTVLCRNGPQCRKFQEGLMFKRANKMTVLTLLQAHVIITMILGLWPQTVLIMRQYWAQYDFQSTRS